MRKFVGDENSRGHCETQYRYNTRISHFRHQIKYSSLGKRQRANNLKRVYIFICVCQQNFSGSNDEVLLNVLLRYWPYWSPESNGADTKKYPRQIFFTLKFRKMRHGVRLNIKQNITLSPIICIKRLTSQVPSRKVEQGRGRVMPANKASYLIFVVFFDTGTISS